MSANKSFCKVCHDAGKSAAEYNSHYVRDRPGGNVICPTILKQNCNYCKKPGHTPSCCPELKGKYVKQQQQAQALEKKPLTTQERSRALCATPPPHNKNYFNSLSKIIENEEVAEVEQAKNMAALNENFPMPSAKINRADGGQIIRASSSVKLSGWSTIASKAKAQQVPVRAQAPEPEEASKAEAPKPKEEAPKPKEEAGTSKAEAEAPKPKAEAPAKYVPAPVSSWADYD
jgi:hypothetical protein